MTDRKTEFWWASIHGADPEPVEKAEHEGRACVYTLGCADPFYLDEKPCPVRFLTMDNLWGRWVFSDTSRHAIPKPLDRPEHPDKKLAAEAALAAQRAATPKGRVTTIFTRGHGWRGPR